MGGPGAHVLLEAFGDGPVGPDAIKKHAPKQANRSEIHGRFTTFPQFTAGGIIQNHFLVRSLSTMLPLSSFLLYSCCAYAPSLPEHVMVAVDLRPFLRALQDPAVPHHGAAGARRAVAAVLPVVQHEPVGGGVEDGESVRHSCWHGNGEDGEDVWLQGPEPTTRLFCLGDKKVSCEDTKGGGNNRGTKDSLSCSSWVFSCWKL